MSHFTSRTSGTNKRRHGISRGVKRLLTMLSQARPKSKSRPNTLTLFDIVSLKSSKQASRRSICAEPGSSFARNTALVHPPGPSRPARKRPSMADRIVDVGLESLYEEDGLSTQYVFAAALQDVWHAQDIEAHTRL